MHKHLIYPVCFFLMMMGSVKQLAAQHVSLIDFKVIGTQEEWDSVLKVSSGSGLPVFVSIHAEWCKYCRLMEREAYSDPPVAAYFNHSFINVMMDGEKAFGKTFAQRQGVTGFPTLIFLNGKGSVLQRVNEYVEPPKLLSYARRAFRKSDFIPVIEAKFIDKSISHEEMLSYLDYIETTDYNKAIQLAGDYLDALDTKEYYDSAVFRIITKYALDPGYSTPQRVVGMWKMLNDYYGEEMMEHYFAELYSHHLREAILQKSDSMVRMLFPLMEKVFEPGDQQEGRLGTWKIFCAETGNPDGYNQVVMEEFARALDPYEFLYREAHEVAMDYDEIPGFLKMVDSWMDTLAAMKKFDFDAAYVQAYVKIRLPDYDAAEKKIRQLRLMAKTKKEQELVQQLLQILEYMKSTTPEGEE
jgi:thiol-disulfide isomerase/thioredoxin